MFPTEYRKYLLFWHGILLLWSYLCIRQTVGYKQISYHTKEPTTCMLHHEIVYTVFTNALYPTWATGHVKALSLPWSKVQKLSEFALLCLNGRCSGPPHNHNSWLIIIISINYRMIIKDNLVKEWVVLMIDETCTSFALYCRLKRLQDSHEKDAATITNILS